MRNFAGFIDKNAVIWTHAGVDHADIRCDEGDFGKGRGFDEWGGGFFLRGEDDTVGGCKESLSMTLQGVHKGVQGTHTFDSQGSDSLVYGV